jgi:hypothetical protein
MLDDGWKMWRVVPMICCRADALPNGDALCTEMREDERQTLYKCRLQSEEEVLITAEEFRCLCIDERDDCEGELPLSGFNMSMLDEALIVNGVEVRPPFGGWTQPSSVVVPSAARKDFSKPQEVVKKETSVADRIGDSAQDVRQDKDYIHRLFYIREAASSVREATLREHEGSSTRAAITDPDGYSLVCEHSLGTDTSEISDNRCQRALGDEASEEGDAPCVFSDEYIPLSRTPSAASHDESIARDDKIGRQKAKALQPTSQLGPSAADFAQFAQDIPCERKILDL